MPKAFSESEKELIRTRLVKHGYRLFSAYGLRKTNVEEIARAAGISKGAFYLFYQSKEELFLDAAEMAETLFRKELLEAIDLPGPSPRARLFAVFQKAFALLKTIPIVQFFSGTDFDLLFRRIPQDKMQEHLANDRAFFDELIAHCQRAGIRITVPSGQIIAMLYPLVMTAFHEDDLGRNQFSGSIDTLLELVAACCLGEVENRLQKPIRPAARPKKKG